jgi:DNA-binding CsgD family transcriptional regulator
VLFHRMFSVHAPKQILQQAPTVPGKARTYHRPPFEAFAAKARAWNSAPQARALRQGDPIAIRFLRYVCRGMSVDEAPTVCRSPTIGKSGRFRASERATRHVVSYRLALDAASERFSTQRLQLPVPSQSDQNTMDFVAEPSDGAFYVLNSDLEIVLAWSSDELRETAHAGLDEPIVERLPLVIERSVRALTAHWISGAVNQCGIGYPVPFLIVRTRPMSGPAGLFIGVSIDRFQPPNSLLGPAERFHISPRELQVLAILLEGKHLDQMAERLHITSSTVQDHIKSMLDKTESSNRSELIARVLGWHSTPSSPKV